jgi:hypothetical protein
MMGLSGLTETHREHVTVMMVSTIICARNKFHYLAIAVKQIVDSVRSYHHFGPVKAGLFLLP